MTDHLMSKPLQLSSARVGVETQIFEILAEDDTAEFTHLELAMKTNVDPVLMSMCTCFLSPVLQTYEK